MTRPVASASRRAQAQWLVPLALLALLIGNLALTPPLTPGSAGTREERAEVGREIRRAEARFRRKSLKKFPGDTWSQGDDFGRQERAFVNSQATATGMRPGAVLEAIDRDVKAFPGGERGRVPPCMPRPFYQ